MKNKCSQNFTEVKLEVRIPVTSFQSCSQLDFLRSQQTSGGSTCAYLRPCQVEQDLLTSESRCVMSCPCAQDGRCEIAVIEKTKSELSNSTVCDINIM